MQWTPSVRPPPGRGLTFFAKGVGAVRGSVRLTVAQVVRTAGRWGGDGSFNLAIYLCNDRLP